MSRVTTYTETVTLQELHCAECGILFAAPAQWLTMKSETKGRFYCPNGHSLIWTVSDNAQLRKQVQEEQASTNRLEAQLTHARDQLKAAEKELAHHKKRVANGVCPCCNRSFVQLQQHMKTKHPEYAKEEQSDFPVSQPTKNSHTETSQQRIIAVLKKSEKPLSPSEICHALRENGRDITINAVRVTLHKMRKATEVIAPAHGQYTLPG